MKSGYIVFAALWIFNMWGWGFVPTPRARPTPPACVYARACVCVRALAEHRAEVTLSFGTRPVLKAPCHTICVLFAYVLQQSAQKSHVRFSA